MLSFRMYPMENLNGPYSSWYDKAHLLKGKTAGWTKEDHEKAGFRMVPNSPVRKGSFVGKNAVLMPCYVNIGAYIDEGTMIDTFARAGSCCQIGKNCHISAGSGHYLLRYGSFFLFDSSCLLLQKYLSLCLHQYKLQC